jgi:carboxypeptidase Taq
MELAGSARRGPWLEARERADFAASPRSWRRTCACGRELAACFPEADHPYDALMDAFEPG